MAGIHVFLFSDIIDSTGRWEADADAMATALELHDAIVHQAVERAGGTVFKHTGDGVAAVFDAPRPAIDAALAALVDLDGADWAGEPIQIRLGIHAGEAIARDDDWFGTTVTRAARVMSAAAAGQLLVTEVAWHLCDTPDGLVAEMYGTAALKGIAEPLSLIGVATSDNHPGPAPQSTQSRRSSLPGEPPALIGRNELVDQLVDAVPQRRLTTLVGPAGIGASTVALAVAHRLLHDAFAGVWYVDLAQAGPDTPIVGLVADACGPLELPRTSPDELASAFAGTGRQLLVLDSCERAQANVAELAGSLGPSVTLLATGRTPLGVTDEHVTRIGPLTEGDARQLLDACLARLDLFIDATTDQPALDRLVVATDGLPLAIELAAACARTAPVSVVADLVEDSIAILRRDGGTGDSASLEAALDRSFDALDEPAREALLQLSVFRGFTFEAMLAVLEPPASPAEVFDRLTTLVDHSLVHRDDNERYRLLEPIRAHAAALLRTTGRADEVEQRHRTWVLDRFAALKQDAMSSRFPFQHLRPVSGTAVEIANAHRVVDRALDEGDVDAATAMLAAAGQEFFRRGEFTTVSNWCQRALDVAEQTDLDVRAALTWAVGQNTWRAGSYETAEPMLAQALELYIEAGDRFGQFLSRTFLAATYWDLGRLTDAGDEFDRVATLAHELGPDVLRVGGAPFIYWNVMLPPDRTDPLVGEALDAVDDFENDGHLLECRALRDLGAGAVSDAARHASAAIGHFRTERNAGCLAHAMEVGALVAGSAEALDAAAEARGTLRAHRASSGIPVLALEAVTADDVDDMLATMPAAERDRREETGAARALVDGADRLVSALDAVGRS